MKTLGFSGDKMWHKRKTKKTLFKLSLFLNFPKERPSARVVLGTELLMFAEDQLAASWGHWLEGRACWSLWDLGGQGLPAQGRDSPVLHQALPTCFYPRVSFHHSPDDKLRPLWTWPSWRVCSLSNSEPSLGGYQTWFLRAWHGDNVSATPCGLAAWPISVYFCSVLLFWRSLIIPLLVFKFSHRK